MRARHDMVSGVTLRQLFLGVARPLVGFCLWSLCTIGEAAGLPCTQLGVVQIAEDFEALDIGLERSAGQQISLENQRSDARCDARKGEVSLGPPMIYFEQGNVKQRYVATVPDPDKPSNHALLLTLRKPNVERGEKVSKGRAQVSIYGNRGINGLLLSFRLRLGEDFKQLVDSGKEIDWLTIAEFWSDPVWTGGKFPYRMSVNLTRPANSAVLGFYVSVKAQRYDPVKRRWGGVVWEQRSADPVVPVGQWVAIAYQVQTGISDGEFRIGVGAPGDTPAQVISISGPTVDSRMTNPKGMTHFNPIKLYTGKQTLDLVVSKDRALSILWDDLMITGCEVKANATCHAAWNK